MKKYKVVIFDPEQNDTYSVVVDAANREHAMNIAASDAPSHIVQDAWRVEDVGGSPITFKQPTL